MKGSVVIQTKVSEAEMRQLEAIRKSYGFKSVYELMAGLVSSFIRYADTDKDNDENLLPQELRRVFEDLKNQSSIPSGKYNPSKTLIREMICLFEREGKRGSSYMRYRFNPDGTMTSTCNVNTILKTMMSNAYPDIDKRIRGLTHRMAEVSYESVLDRAVECMDSYVKNGIATDIIIKVS